MIDASGGQREHNQGGDGVLARCNKRGGSWPIEKSTRGVSFRETLTIWQYCFIVAFERASRGEERRATKIVVGDLFHLPGCNDSMCPLFVLVGPLSQAGQWRVHRRGL